MVTWKCEPVKPCLPSVAFAGVIDHNNGKRKVKTQRRLLDQEDNRTFSKRERLLCVASAIVLCLLLIVHLTEDWVPPTQYQESNMYFTEDSTGEQIKGLYCTS